MTGWTSWTGLGAERAGTVSKAGPPPPLSFDSGAGWTSWAGKANKNDLAQNNVTTYPGTGAGAIAAHPDRPLSNPSPLAIAILVSVSHSHEVGFLNHDGAHGDILASDSDISGANSRFEGDISGANSRFEGDISGAKLPRISKAAPALTG